MKLSTRSRYGTRLMLELALNYNNGPVLLKDISQKQDVSLKYLGQLIIPLKAAGLIGSTRGAHGGYFLAKPPSEIKISKIVTSVEGSLDLVECVSHESVCEKSDDCITRKIWKELSNRCYQFLDSITLSELAEFCKSGKNIDKFIKEKGKV
ncbi:MAG: RrF2 family transcriptional regulator [Actinomycetota bacterium]